MCMDVCFVCNDNIFSFLLCSDCFECNICVWLCVLFVLWEIAGHGEKRRYLGRKGNFWWFFVSIWFVNMSKLSETCPVCFFWCFLLCCMFGVLCQKRFSFAKKVYKLGLFCCDQTVCIFFIDFGIAINVTNKHQNHCLSLSFVIIIHYCHRFAFHKYP